MISDDSFEAWLKQSTDVAPKETKRMARQASIPGTDEGDIPELNAALEAYKEKRDARMRMGEEEREAKADLHELMRKHKLKRYRDNNAVPPQEAVIEPGEAKLKVRTLAVDASGGEDGGEE